MLVRDGIPYQLTIENEKWIIDGGRCPHLIPIVRFSERNIFSKSRQAFPQLSTVNY